MALFRGDGGEIGEGCSRGQAQLGSQVVDLERSGDLDQLELLQHEVDFVSRPGEPPNAAGAQEQPFGVKLEQQQVEELTLTPEGVGELGKARHVASSAFRTCVVEREVECPSAGRAAA